MSGKSRSQVKREMAERTALAEKLCTFSRKQLAPLGLPAEILDAFDEARSLKKEARRRKMAWVGKQMRDVDPDPLREFLGLPGEAERDAAKRASMAKRYATMLLAGEPVAMEETLDFFQEADRDMLAVLVDEARQEIFAGRGKKAPQRIERYLLEATTPQGPHH